MTVWTYRGRYVGPDEELHGKTAILRDGELKTTVQAPFDDLSLRPGRTSRTTWT